MIDVYIDGYSVKITGHSDTQPCARVSTVHQLMGRLTAENVSEYTDITGLSTITLDSPTDSNAAIFDSLCGYYDDLAAPDMYHRMIRVHRTASKTVGNDEVAKPKRGRKPAAKKEEK